MVSHKLRRIVFLMAMNARKMAFERDKKLKLISELEKELKIAEVMAHNLSSRSNISEASTIKLRMRLDLINNKIKNAKKDL